MGVSVSRLDKSGWSAGAARREAKFAGWRQAARERAAWEASEAGQAYAAALASHPLRAVIAEDLTEESLAASEAGAGWLVKTWDSGTGHREAVAMRRRANLQATLDRAIRRDLAHMVPRGLGDRERSVASAAQRAKQEVRRLCKVMRVNALWTLTYRANQCDRDLALAHLDAFRRRVQAVIPGWAYVATLEQQERGAWHVHLATHALPVHLYPGGVKVKSWEVMRRIWRSVVGELGGAFNEAKRQHTWRPGAKACRSTTSIASYIAGYVAKDMLEGELNRKRYSATRNVQVPECYSAIFAADEASMAGLIDLAFSSCPGQVTSVWFDATRQVYFVGADGVPAPG